MNAITPMHDSMPELDPASVGRLRVLSDFYFFVVAVTDERKGQSLVYKLVTDQEGCSLFKCVDKEGKDYFEINIRELYETGHSMLP